MPALPKNHFMKYILQFLTLSVILYACRPSPAPRDLSGCYQMVTGKDTAMLSLNHEGDTVTGSLSYHWYEKDNNEGSFRGVIKNDSLIVAHYNFQSEGITSVRQIVFKVRGEELLQGYGEIRMKNDTAFFRDVDLVIFDTKHPFQKNCP